MTCSMPHFVYSTFFDFFLQRIEAENRNVGYGYHPWDPGDLLSHTLHSWCSSSFLYGSPGLDHVQQARARQVPC